MNDHGFYLLCSYLALAVAVVWELWSLRRQRQRTLLKVREEFRDQEVET